MPSGRQNGIAVFDRPWKNVVGTLYPTSPGSGNCVGRGNDGRK
jgi:hypothetical protein